MTGGAEVLRNVAQFGSAPALGAGGRWFKSSRSDQVYKGGSMQCVRCNRKADVLRSAQYPSENIYFVDMPVCASCFITGPQIDWWYRRAIETGYAPDVQPSGQEFDDIKNNNGDKIMRYASTPRYVYLVRDRYDGCVYDVYGNRDSADERVASSHSDLYVDPWPVIDCPADGLPEGEE